MALNSETIDTVAILDTLKENAQQRDFSILEIPVAQYIVHLGVAKSTFPEAKWSWMYTNRNKFEGFMLAWGNKATQTRHHQFKESNLGFYPFTNGIIYFSGDEETQVGVEKIQQAEKVGESFFVLGGDDTRRKMLAADKNGLLGFAMYSLNEKGESSSIEYDHRARTVKAQYGESFAIQLHGVQIGKCTDTKFVFLSSQEGTARMLTLDTAGIQQASIKRKVDDTEQKVEYSDKVISYQPGTAKPMRWDNVKVVTPLKEGFQFITDIDDGEKQDTIVVDLQGLSSLRRETINGRGKSFFVYSREDKAIKYQAHENANMLLFGDVEFYSHSSGCTQFRALYRGIEVEVTLTASHVEFTLPYKYSPEDKRSIKLQNLVDLRLDHEGCSMEIENDKEIVIVSFDRDGELSNYSITPVNTEEEDVQGIKEKYNINYEEAKRNFDKKPDKKKKILSPNQEVIVIGESIAEQLLEGVIE